MIHPQDAAAHRNGSGESPVELAKAIGLSSILNAIKYTLQTIHFLRIRRYGIIGLLDVCILLLSRKEFLNGR